MKFLRLFVFVSILLLLNMVVSNSYIISESNNFEESVIDVEKIVNAGKLGVNLLVGFLSIKQVGIVSAEETNHFCCERLLENGAWCQGAETQSMCDQDMQSTVASCTESDFCKPGCCFNPTEGFCVSGATENSCSANGGYWGVDCLTMDQCSKGCCLAGRNTGYMTATQCKHIEDELGYDTEFNTDTDEGQCKFYSEDMGACMLENRICKFETEGECVGENGEWSKDTLCSKFYPIDTDCAPYDSINCAEDKVTNPEIYWFDSCGNRENIYEGLDKKETTWNEGYIKSKESASCSGDDCGNCNYPEESICKGTLEDDQVEAGGYTCKALGCYDEYSKENYDNGESWCVYDSYTGESLDAVGSGHYIRYCHQGEIETDKCGLGYRGQICAEFQYDSGQWQAQCRPNFWFMCFDMENKEECNEVPDCRWEYVDVDEGFQFGSCIPKYPKGFPQNNEFTGEESSTSSEADICSSGSQKCPVIWEKQCALIGTHIDCEWMPIANQHCLGVDFAREMNDLCVSLGDCGGYINFNGTFTEDGYGVRGSEMKGFDDNSHGFKVTRISKNRYNYVGTAEDNLRWNNKVNYDGKELPNTPMYLPSGEEGTYSDIVGLHGDMDADFNNKLGNLAKNWEIGLGIPVGLLGAFGMITLYASLSAAAAASAAGTLAFSTAYAAAITLGSSATAAAAAGTAASTAAITASQAGASGLANAWNPVGWVLLVVAAIIASGIVYMELTGLGDIKQTTVKFTCSQWEPPLGGDNCDVCNQEVDSLGIPCTQNKCESLGKNCKLLNGELDAKNNFDGNAPGDEEPVTMVEVDNPVCVYYFCNTAGATMEPQLDFGQVGMGYEYENKKIQRIGFNSVVENDRINFTITTDVYSTCKYSPSILEPTLFSEEGEPSLEGTIYSKEHTFAVVMPLIEEDSVVDKVYTTYIRCETYCGRVNINEYIVKFQIDPTPDITPPGITGTIPADPGYVQFEETSAPFSVLLDEPADCRYDVNEGTLYSDMVLHLIGGDPEPTEENFAYGIIENLDREENKIYIKCEDSNGNNNTQAYPFTFLPTESALEIASISPTSGLLRENPITEEDPLILDVVTEGGMDSGVANCTYQFGEFMSQTKFFETSSTQHKQIFNNPINAGDYLIKVKCADAVGNLAEGNTSITIILDDKPPIITRAFKSNEGNLKMITDEPAQCSYSLENCGFVFEDGEIISGTFSETHSLVWDAGKNYYIKCKDEFDNTNTGCAIKIRPGIV